MSNEESKELLLKHLKEDDYNFLDTMCHARVIVNIIAVKHNKRRNGKKCKTYWSISEEITADPNNWRIERVNTIWWHTDLPKKIKNVLEMSPDDHKRYGLKRGEFILTLTQVEKFGHVPFKNVINIELTT